MIQLRNVYKEYEVGGIRTTALKNVNLAVDKGEFVVVLGASGSGKSTLLNVAGGIDSVCGGEILIDNQAITELSPAGLTDFRRDYLGFIFQQYHLLPNMTVYENVEVGAQLGKKKGMTHAALREVMIEEHQEKFPYQLSGGQQQRVAIARALAKNPQILFCDEPTGALDEETGKAVLGVLQQINEELETTVFLITHNLGIAAMADKVIKMKSGEIVEIQHNRKKLRARDVNWA